MSKNPEKIVQIINAPPGLEALSVDIEGNTWRDPVVCLALMQDEDRLQYISAQVMTSDGLIESVGNSENFVQIVGGSLSTKYLPDIVAQHVEHLKRLENIRQGNKVKKALNI
jgi:hypothetical protein